MATLNPDNCASGFLVFTAAVSGDFVGMVAAAAGTVSVVDSNGVASTLTLAAGQQIFGVRFKQVTASTVTAGSLTLLTR
jgi:hypothetical protein